MAKVDIYYRPRGSRHKLEKAIAKMPGVQAQLKARAVIGAAVAKSVLAAHRAEGHSVIKVTHGKVDYFVQLSDERGDQAAWAIEKGTRRSRGIAALAKAKAAM